MTWVVTNGEPGRYMPATDDLRADGVSKRQEAYDDREMARTQRLFSHRGINVADGKSLKVGDPAPDFALPSSTGETIRLSDFKGRAEVVVYFYPKDNSPACSAEACSFRDSYEAFRDAGAEVIGISADSEESHRGFSDRLRLPFRLLSDRNGSVRSLFGVPKTLGLIPGRVTYLIDREGIVRHVFSSQLQPARHVAGALEVLKTLRETPR
jgi:thioredoxin-dependent peroxiredoxin